ncbi:hypothetical protein J4461_00720 [Candidatus Pacearchaeota archaeon]|nr:hypothetical protein [Candidatus Pacearchaeota archaeon]
MKMKYAFKKIASVLTGAVMLSSTVALAAAVNYPAPFVKSGNADVAVVVGSLPGADIDVYATVDITNNLQVALAKQTATTGSSTTTTSVTGEAAPLFTGTKIYVNDSLNSVKTVLTKTELPTVLATGSFSGNTDATYTQTLDIGSNPQVTFAKQPTSSDDPDFGLATSTSTANYIYNATVTFNKAVNFTHADSKGADIKLFGQKYTVASATDSTNLVLLKTAEKVSLSSDTPSSKVIIGGKEYTVELVSASDTAATVKVTDSDGNSETKEINENASKKVQGITVAVTNADETNLKLSASVIAGAEKLTLTDGSAVAVGEDSKVIDGTKVTFSNATLSTGTTKITVSVYAPNSDSDAVKPGQTFNDPVFATFKLDFSSLNIPQNSTAREDIKISNSGDDKVQVTFTANGANEKTIQFARNLTNVIQLQHDSDGHNITVSERTKVFKNDYVVVGNEESGHMLKLTTVTNQTTGYNQDKVTFTDVLTGDTIEGTLSSEGTGTVVVGGKSYNIVYNGTPSDDSNFVRLNYPDSTATADMVVYPTIKTSKGAKLAFYEPVTIDINNWDAAGTVLSNLKFPDGDGYTDTTFVNLATISGNWTISGAGTGTLNSSTNSEVNLTIGALTYALRGTGTVNETNVYLRSSETGGALILDPAIVIFEEKDDNAQYHAVVVTLEPGATGDDGIGVNDVIRSWQGDATWDAISLASDSKKTKEADLYGTVGLVDSSDSDQKSAIISYPDEQAFANIYVAEKAAEITGGDTGTTGTGVVKELGSILVKDTEVAQVASKNLIVVGGSCVNTLAAELLGGAGCGASFEQSTGVGAGSFLIQTFSRTGGKVATLVAGYHAQDTANAAKYLTTQTVDIMAGKKYKGTSATSASVVTESTTTNTSQ